MNVHSVTYTFHHGATISHKDLVLPAGRLHYICKLWDQWQSLLNTQTEVECTGSVAAV